MSGTRDGRGTTALPWLEQAPVTCACYPPIDRKAEKGSMFSKTTVDLADATR